MLITDVQPLRANDGEQRIAVFNSLPDQLDEIGAERDVIDINEYAILAKLSLQPIT